MEAPTPKQFAEEMRSIVDPDESPEGRYRGIVYMSAVLMSETLKLVGYEEGIQVLNSVMREAWNDIQDEKARFAKEMQEVIENRY